MRASSLPPLTPPQSPRLSNAVRDKVPKTPSVPSVRRRYGLESNAEAKYSNQLQTALSSLTSRRASPPTGLRSPFVLKPSPRGVIHEEEDEHDGDLFVIHRPDVLERNCESRYLNPDLDWSQDLFDPSPAYVRPKRPNHKHKRSSSAAVSRYQYSGFLQTPLPTIPSATPSPAISAAPSPVARPLALAPELDFNLLVPSSSVPHAWPGMSTASSLLPTPTFSTPGLSPSATGTPGSPLVGARNDYFMLQTPYTPHTPHTPRPVPE